MTSRETEIIVAVLQERDDARREQIEELKELIKEGFEKATEEREELDTRITNVENEIKFVKRVGAPFISAVSIAFSAWLNTLIKGQ